MDEGRQAGQGCGLLAAGLSEFGHAQDQGECGSLADAGIVYVSGIFTAIDNKPGREPFID